MTLRLELRTAVHHMLDAHWVDEGYTVPNDSVYPFQWLWDSCFHALVWHELGRDDRAVRELEQALSTQGPGGFVPHMNYQRQPTAHADLWGRVSASSITQPPMYGHAVAELRRAGVAVPAELVDRAERGLRFLTERRPRTDGLVELCHPWESGTDDSPRWDDLCPGGYSVERWRPHKSALVARIEHDPAGAPISNPDFPVASVGFNALVAFNLLELADVTDRADLAAQAEPLIEALTRRWEVSVGWVDAGPTATGSGRVRTADGLLPLLVVADEDQRSAAWSMVDDPGGFAAPYGPRGVHGAEPTYDPSTYWRGPCWPQLAYLLWLAARREGRSTTAARLAASTVAGAQASSLAEYWDPETGAAGGAVPQSWTGLAVLMARRAADDPRG